MHIKQDIKLKSTLWGLPANDIANYVLSRKVEHERGVPTAITRRRLQKLMYFMQGYHLYFLEKPLFEEDFVTHPSGFIIPKIDERFEENGYLSLPKQDADGIEKWITKETKEVILAVLTAYQQCDGKVMEELVHQEDAWLDLEFGEVLTKEKIYNCFADKFRK